MSAGAALILAASCLAGVTVYSPAPGSTTGTSVHFVASADAAAGVDAMKIYVDDRDSFTVKGGSLDTYLSLGAGAHYVVVQAWDNWGNVMRSAETINVAQSSNDVFITQPSIGVPVGSPMHVVATATSPVGIDAMMIYVDNQARWSGRGASVDAWIDISVGQHYVVVQSWDWSGKVTKAPITVNVVSGSGGSASSSGGSQVSIPSYATTISNIDQMGGWDSCTVCAGIDGSGPVANYSMTIGRGDPSLDGSSTQFWIGGGNWWSAALWWKQLQPNSNARNFVYDLYFYIQNPGASQALEFDLNQALNGQKYIFGTQCNIGDGHWDIWDAANVHWVNTGIYCGPPAAYTWHHLTWEFQRNSAGQQVFVAVTYDGQKQYINRAFWPIGNGPGNELNFAFQMDGKGPMVDYSTWLDKVTLSYW
jgi:hypothetical protein